MPNKKPNPYDITTIFEEMTLNLIGSMRRNLKRHKLEETKEGFRWEQWQRAKLRSIANYRKSNSKVIHKAFRDSEKLVDDVLKHSFKTGENRIHRAWNRFLNAILKPFGIERNVSIIKVPIPKSATPVLEMAWDKLARPTEESSFFGLNERKLEALQDTVKNDLKKAEHGVLRKMDDVYRQTIYKAEVNMTSGAKTLDQAIDMATKEFLQKGINTIEYADGRRVNIASYAEMALRTASQRATFLGEGKKRDELGVYTVLMSAHNNCSPMCLPYQGTVMIDDVYTSLSKDDAENLSKETGYVLLSEAMKHHAFHPNCRHTLSTFFPGVSSMPKKVDDKKATENYNAEQKQRYYERGIRMYKRLEAGTLDPDTQAGYSRKVQEWQGKLKDHLNEHPDLRRSARKEKVEGGLTHHERNAVIKRQEEFEQYQSVLSDDIPDRQTFEQLRNGEDWSLVKLDYRRRMRLIDNPDLALPNADKVTAADAKFEKYLFNPESKDGWPKGRAFTSRLGYNADNWKELQQQIIKKAKLYPATHKLTDQYGGKYEQRQVLYGLNDRPANVIVGWRVKEGAKLTTAYIKEVKTNGDN